VWSGVGGKSGWSRESLAGVAQKLIRSLLASANIRGAGSGPATTASAAQGSYSSTAGGSGQGTSSSKD
jgi:hypothetical protein